MTRHSSIYTKATGGGCLALFGLPFLLAGLAVIVLFAVWWGLRMAKGVTGPIRALVEGTEKVAGGDLNVVVKASSDDEIGFLVRSFNQMTRDLREARSGLELSNTELDQRRRYMEIVLRNVDAGVVSVDAEGRISTINPSAQRLLGIAPGTGVIGSKLEEVLTRTEYRGEDASVPIRPLHKMTEEQVVKEMSVFGLEWTDTLDFLPWQHMMFFGRDS